MSNLHSMDGYMIQARLQALAEDLADLGYENDLLVEEYGKKEIRIYREDLDRTFVADYEIQFDEEKGERAIGFLLRLHRLEGRRLEGSYGTPAGPVIAVREEGLPLDGPDTAGWIEEHMTV